MPISNASHLVLQATVSPLECRTLDETITDSLASPYAVNAIIMQGPTNVRGLKRTFGTSGEPAVTLYRDDAAWYAFKLASCWHLE